MKGKRQRRSEKGLTIAALVAFIAVFVIGPLSMFVFEMTRYNLAAQQLKNCLDSAALAAACAVTGSNSSNAGVTQTAAMNAAIYMFQQNSIFNYSLSSVSSTPSYGTSAPTWSPAPNAAQLYFEFLDPVTKNPVAYNNSSGKIIRVFGAWGFVPSTAKFIGIGQGPYIIQDQSDGGLPQLDVILCFDTSASMDDFTNVSLVNRYQNGAYNGYALPQDTSQYNGQNTCQGPLYYAIGATNATGTAVNATWPMQWDSAGSGGQGVYTWNSSGYGSVNGYAQSSLTNLYTNGGSRSYTDMVVNLDGTATQSTGVTVNGFTFPADDATHKGLGILVEAMRGNLESVSAATAAHVPYTTWGITPKAGWFQAYYQGVLSAQPSFPSSSAQVPLRHPIGDAIVASENFFSILNQDADCHFGLCTFSSNAGTSATSLEGTNPTLGGGSTSSSPYPASPISCPQPTINLNPTAGAAYSNYSTASPPSTSSVNGALFWANTTTTPYTLGTVYAVGGTNIADSLDQAISQMLGSKSTDPPGPTPLGRGAQALARPGATRAIVLFTDGLPTMGGDNGTSDPNSQAEATFAKKAGIPIYTIGLCMVSSLQTDQTTVLTDQASSTGIAALSGNGATFTQTTSASQLNSVFQNVARQLVQLVQ
ncbi:MAG TPA: vWA domain-containing protein [Oculatellaceae cyanobacterium]